MADKQLEGSAPPQPGLVEGSSIFTRVPVDVFSRIFSLLKEDEKGQRLLLSCSLVSKVWREVALPHLFSTVKSIDGSYFQPLFDFVGTSPHLARYISRLTLWSSTFYCDAFYAILPNLLALSQLDLTEVVVHSVSPPSSPRALNVLEVCCMRGHEEASELAALAALLKYLCPDTLEVAVTPEWLIQSGSSESDFSLLPPLSINIRSIRFVGIGDAWLHYDFFSAVLALNTLRHLKTRGCSRRSVDSLTTLLWSAGRNISTLDLDLSGFGRVGTSKHKYADWSALGQVLSACPHLRVLGLLLEYTYDAVWETASTDLPDNLRFPYRDMLSATSPTLSVLVIGLQRRVWINQHKRDERIDLWDLAELDRLWFCERFPYLEHITVRLALRGIYLPPYARKDVETAVTRALPGLQKQGLLHIVTFDHLPESED